MKKLAVAVCAVVVSTGAVALEVKTSAELIEALGDTATDNEIVLLSGTYDLTASPAQIPTAGTIVRGATGDPKDVVVNGQGLYRFLDFSGANALVKDLTVSNCYNAGASNSEATWGGGVRFGSSWKLQNCVFANCTNAYCGGAFWSKSPGTATNCVFRGNQASKGGALYAGGDATSQTISLVDCRAYGNSASADGGAVFTHKNGTVLFTKCLFEGNSALGSGGAVGKDGNGSGTYGTGAATYFSNTVFRANSAKANGGAIGVVKAGTLVLSKCVFERNLALGGTGGGAVYGGSAWESSNRIFSRISVMDTCVFVGNVATNASANGGAVYGAVALMKDTVFTNNVGGASGGAWSFDTTANWSAIGKPPIDGETYRATNCTFYGNTLAGVKGTAGSAGNFAGGAVSAGANYGYQTFVDCRFIGNVLTNHTNRPGSGSAMSAGNCRLEDCLFEDNLGGKALLSGSSGAGAAFYGTSTGGIVRCTFRRNHNVTSGNSSGIIFGSTTNFVNVVENCTFDGNDIGSLNVRTGWLRLTDSTFCNHTNGPAVTFYHGNIFGGGDNTVAKVPSYEVYGLIDRCVFTNNVNVSGSGGAIYAGAWNGSQCTPKTASPVMAVRNSLFAGNSAKGGGAVSSQNNGRFSFENCTFVNNSVVANNNVAGGLNSEANGNYTGVQMTAVTNCLFYGNTDQQKSTNYDDLVVPDSTLVAHTFETHGYLTDGERGNIVAADPQIGDDYAPLKGSCCINAGANAPWMVGARDLRNNRRRGRIAEQIVDIGCYEYWPLLGMMLLLK